MKRIVALALGLLGGTLACGDDEQPTSGSPVRTIGAPTEAFDASGDWYLSVWGPSSDQVFAVGGKLIVSGRPYGEGTIRQRTPAGWSQMSLPAETPILNWVFGFGPADVWAVGGGGTILHYDGTEWRSQETPTEQELWGVWGCSPTDLWAVGGGSFSSTVTATVLRYDGTAWVEVELPRLVPSFADQIFKVWGTACDDVYAVGRAGVILHWDGATLVQLLDVPLSHTQDYVSLWGIGRDRIAIAGGRSGPQIGLYDGAEVGAVDLPNSPGMNGVWMADDGTFYTVGIRGVAAVFAADDDLPANLVQFEPVTPSRTLDLHAVFGLGDELFMVGGNLGQANGPYEGVVLEASLVTEEAR